MSITFHCEYCGKKIQASDDSGGKWGKCPSCHKKLYVPSPDSGEELKLAPIDESDIEKQKQLIAQEQVSSLNEQVRTQRKIHFSDLGEYALHRPNIPMK